MEQRHEDVPIPAGTPTIKRPRGRQDPALMRKRKTSRQWEQGTTLIEVLIASMILVVGLMGLTGLWAYAETLTVDTDEIAIAYNLGRQALEQVKVAGFTQAPEGTTVAYYNANQGAATSGTARYTVATGVVSSAVASGTAGSSGATPSQSALRTVTVSVRRGNAGRLLYATNTYLVGHGI